MFPQAPLSAESFSATFRPVSSEEDDDDEPINRGIHRFESSTPVPSGQGRGHSGHSPAFSSTEGISSCQVTERSCPAVLSVHHPWKARTLG